MMNLAFTSYFCDYCKGDFVIVIISWHSTVILTYQYELKILKFNLMAYNLLLL